MCINIGWVHVSLVTRQLDSWTVRHSVDSETQMSLLSCPNHNKWLTARDELYEEIMHNAWNPEGKYFGQSYKDTDM